jgi:DNA-binding NtrC family response regulator
MSSGPDISPPQVPPVVHGTILLVEDECLISIIASDALRDAGYKVIEAANADEALAILLARTPVDLVISDVRMPGSLDGLGLLAATHEAFPSLPVIMTSGHLDPELALSSGACQFLPKPYGLDAVVTAVETELERIPKGPLGAQRSA